MEKHAAIMAAARDSFLAQPYDRVSMEAIAAAAGVSKVTLYAKFGSKDQLFVAAMSATSHDIYGRARLEVMEGQKLDQVLVRLGRDFVTMILDPQIVALWAVMMQAADKAPGLPRQFYQNVISTSLDTLAEAFRVAAARGEIVCDDPRQAAVMFTSMVQGQYRSQQELGLLESIPVAELEQHVQACVSVLIRGMAP
jgi:TetR/AcrR family transcriptional regulator, mexJK operon transcriptional repressor